MGPGPLLLWWWGSGEHPPLPAGPCWLVVPELCPHPCLSVSLSQMGWEAVLPRVDKQDCGLGPLELRWCRAQC